MTEDKAIKKCEDLSIAIESAIYLLNNNQTVIINLLLIYRIKTIKKNLRLFI
jgi:hypothetical protein